MNSTELRKNIYKVLDQVIDSGIPVPIERKGRSLYQTAMEHAKDDAVKAFFKDLVADEEAGYRRRQWRRRL